MKYYKLDYNANQPSNKQISVPTDSVYGVAVKVYRNGELVNGDLSVGGLSATTKGDWKLVDLSSGSDVGIGELDVELDVPPTAREDISTNNTYAAIQMSETNYRAKLTAVKNYLSAGTLPEQITVGTDNLDFTAKYRKVKDGQAGEWIAYGGTAWRINHTNDGGTTLAYNKTDDNRWRTYVGGEYLYYDTITLNTETDSIQFASTTNVTDTEAFDADVVQTIAIDTKDGVAGNFKLLISTQDKGYIEAE